MKRKIYYVLAGFGVVMALSALALALLPSLALGRVEAKLQSELAERKMSASWESLEATWGGEFELRALHLKAPERGVTLDVERVTISPRLRTLISGSPEIKLVRVEGVAVVADLIAIRNGLAGDTPEETSGEEEGEDQAGGGGAAAQLKKVHALMRVRLPRVEVERAQLLTTLGDKPLADVELTAATILASEEALEVDAHGYVTTRYERLPKLLRQRHRWRVELGMRPEDGQVSVKLDSGEEGLALLDMELPRIAQWRVGSVEGSVKLGEWERAQLTGYEVYGKLGGRQDLIASIEAERLSVGLGAGRRPLLEGEGVALEVAPSKLRELGNLRERFMPLGGALKKLRGEEEGGAGVALMASEGSGAGVADYGAQLGKALKLGGQVSEALGRADLELERASLALHVPLDEAELRRVEILSGLDVSLRESVLDIKGDASDGRFEANARFLPGQPLPYAASLFVSHMNISKLPGMQEGRTLPSRGVRGTIGGVVSGSLHLLTPPAGVSMRRGAGSIWDEVSLRGALSWRDGMIEINGLAEEPLDGLRLELDGGVRWWPGRGEVALEEVTARYNGLEATARGALLNWPLNPVLEVTAELPMTSCQRMIDALPDAMLGAYRDVTISGSAAPRLWFKWPLYDPQRFMMELDGLAEEDTPEFRRTWRREHPDEENEIAPIRKHYACKITRQDARASAWPEVIFVSRERSISQKALAEHVPRSLNVSQSDVHWLNRPFIKRVSEGVSADAEVYVGPGLDTYVPLEELPPWVGGAAYLSEEILFYFGRGVNFALIRKAMRINLERGRFVYGGSTVTQQLIKNLFLTRDKTLARKLQEALIGLRMDEVVSKDRILELYLNCIEFGKDLYGIEPAARHYFNKSARELSPMEAVFLAVLKPSPRYGEHLKRRGELPGPETWFAKRIETIFKRMVEYKVMTQTEADAARPYTLRWEGGQYVPQERSVEDVIEDLMKPW